MSGCKKDHQELKEATDREIGELKAQIDQIKAKKREKKAQLTKTIAEKDELIISLTEKVGLQDYTISDSQKTIKKMQSNLDENLDAFKEKDGRISSLEQQILDLKQSLSEQKIAEIEEIKTKYEKALEKKRVSKKKLKDELYDR